MSTDNPGDAQSPRPLERLLSVSEVAVLTGLSASFLNKLRLSGGGPPFAKLGRRVVYRHAKVVAWVDEQSHRSTSEYNSGAVSGSNP
jgi:predicted DNA-binding transcriptional regulator AlpA